MATSRAIAAISVCVVCGLASQLSAQSSTGPAFEVASVKPNDAGEPGTLIRSFPNRFNATNAPLQLLVRLAFQIQDSQVVGGPDWFNSARFDIDARTQGEPSPDQVAGMMRALLVDRFKLRTHPESRELPIYALVMARTDSKPGPQLRPTDCGAAVTNAPSNPNANQPCGTVRNGPGRVTARGIPLSQVATVLSPLVRRVVMDRTGITGNVDFDLEWTPDQIASRDPNLPTSPADPNAPSIFTAIQEQLGLKLDSRRGPIEVLVIDSIERPSPD